MTDTKISELTEMTTPTDGDYAVVVDDGTTKKITWLNIVQTLKAYFDTIYRSIAASGNVFGPASNTDNYIPQWNGADSKTLKDGLSLVTTVGTTGVDTAVPTEQAVREALAALASNTIQIEICWPGKPDDAAVISVWPPACTIPANLTGATYHGVVDPAAEAVVSLSKNGAAAFGTLTVAAGSTDVVTLSSSETSFNGTTDRLDITFPAQDADWSGVSFKIVGVRS